MGKKGKKKGGGPDGQSSTEGQPQAVAPQQQQQRQPQQQREQRAPQQQRQEQQQQQQARAVPPSTPQVVQPTLQGAWGQPRAPVPQSSSNVPNLQFQAMSVADAGRGRGRGRGEPPRMNEPRRIPGMPAPQQTGRPQWHQQQQQQQPPRQPPPPQQHHQQQQQQQPLRQPPPPQQQHQQQQQQQQQPLRQPPPPRQQQQQQQQQQQVSKRPEGVNKKELTDAQKNQMLSLIPQRKNMNRGGGAGRPIEVITNMISIIFGSKFTICAVHYDLKMDPEKPRFMRKPVYDAIRAKYFPKNWPAFDGRVNVYAAGDLPFGDCLTGEVTAFNPERQVDMEFKIKLEKVNVIDMSWLPRVQPGLQESDKVQTAIQALDVILRSAPANNSIVVGRSFFQSSQQRAFDLTGGMEMWLGTFQSAVLGWKPYFNVDVANKAFPKSIGVIDMVVELLTDPRSGPPRQVTYDLIQGNLDVLERFLKKLKVIFQLPQMPSSKRTKSFNGFAMPANEATFNYEGNEITVEQYFTTVKRCRLSRPDLPTLWVGPKNRKDYVPMELCYIAPGLVLNGKLNEEQTRKMIRETAKDAKTRMERILNSFNQIKYNEHPTMKEFGLSLSGQLEKVNARVLAPPILQYQRSTEQPRKGVWRAGTFLNAQHIPENCWTVLNLTNLREDNLRQFVSSMTDFGRQNGMDLGRAQTPFISMRISRDPRQLQDYLSKKKTEGIKLLIVVIPNFGTDIYPKVKQQAELQVGILTQCLKQGTLQKVVERRDASTAVNILLKINSKLNGVNHTFEKKNRPACINGPVIIFGADVTHPSPDATDIPSIAAVAASHSDDVFKYNVDIRLQPARQEIIIHLEEIVIKQLQAYFKMTKQRPEKIFFYRDGVSEGQFAQVMFFELQAIKNACRKFGAPNKYEPKITFLVVQKRHHTRFFPADPRNSDDRNGNVQAGTIVDTKITHPSHIDFYLVSHASIQGTARPTKYRCLCNESELTEDEIEQLTYYLCHMFSRCTRSVSYPAPTYYAHLAAFRARALTHGVNIQMNNLERAQLNYLTLHNDIVNKSPMFFV